MPRQLIANSAAIATHHPLGAAAGLEMLQDGGNAVDSAVAAMLALCVVIPGSVGLGGYGGSAIIRLAKPKSTGQVPSHGRPPTADRRHPQVFAIDFDSRAPLCFREGDVTADSQSSYYGARAVTVPAVIAGLEVLLSQFGTKSWKEVSQPAIHLAEAGFDVDIEHKRFLDRCAPQFDPQSLASLFPTGTLPQVGDRWRQPSMARLLQQLAHDGPLSFYQGDIARRIVRFLQVRGGLLALEDFCSYDPQLVDAIRAPVRDVELFTPPPPSGGITSLEIIQTMERILGRDACCESLGGEYYHLLAEASKICWDDRNKFLGDPEYVNIPMDDVLSDKAAAARANQINMRTPPVPSRALRSDSPHTSNVIATDGDGTMISVTATQGWMYGSHLVVDELGLVLNHGMSRFNYSTGHPNAPVAGKRMQHNMSPMIALCDGQPAFAVGMPGGPKIVSVTAQLMLHLIAGGATPAAAIAAPRLHTEGDEPLLVSTHTPDSVILELESLGHTVRREDDMGGPVNVLAFHRASGTINVASGEGTGDVAGF
jgi:gamma-glutamyltranspeptidase / glutathione hydrolase